MVSTRNPRISVRPLTSDDWPVIERLFGANGACGGCWCMYWRLPRGGRLWQENKGTKNKQAFRRLVKAGKVHACFAFAADEPVGWCCVGPRADFPRIERTKALATDWKPDTWSVTCLYIKSCWRRKGVATKLVNGATRLARDLGAAELEAYPVRTPNDGEPIPAAFAWTGVPALFTRHRFVTITPPDRSRDVYRRRFRKAR